MRHEGVEEIRKKFEIYTKLLKEEFSQGLILPSSKDALIKEKAPNVPTQQQVKPAAVTTTTTTTSASKQQATNGLKIETTKLKLVEEFKCRVNELYNCFTDINVCFSLSLSQSFNFNLISDGSCLYPKSKCCI